jgi:endogenous inhibitor of DNA gyrase (YacG/DUF329 family)
VQRISRGKIMKVKCPTCSKSVIWSEKAKDRPFCSERCKLIDLGAWADGSHAIPGKTVEEEMMSQQWEIEQQNAELH